jgi:hypothetical protein
MSMPHSRRAVLVVVIALCFAITTRLNAFDHDASDRPNQLVSRLSPSEMREVAQRIIGSDAVVCDVATLPIKGSQSANLLASIDMSGRHFCNSIVRITLGKTPSAVQEIDAWMVETPSSMLRDLDRDGFPELLVPRSFSPYEGAQACVAVYPVVFACSGTTCAEASVRFRTFYERAARDQERALLKEMAVKETMGSDYDERGLPCMIMKYDKLRRAAGVDRLAGVDVAMKWKNSSDAFLRRKAVAIFDDINDHSTRRELELLAKDSDPLVAGYAQISLRRR